MKQYLKILPLLGISLFGEENLNLLLNKYEYEAELSKITKKEEAGVLDIYTSHDLQMMQIKTLEDLLRILPGFHYTRQYDNLTVLQKPSISSRQLSSVRLYVNDHDLSSNSFGSSFLIWGKLPLEYIDHIEVYKGAASVEFGNETSTVIIKMYTKSPQREEGSKIRLYGDNYGSKNVDAYIASKNDSFSYFAYANTNAIKRRSYTNEFNGKEYALDSGITGNNIYANIKYEDWFAELGSYTKKGDNFLGLGIYATPSGGDVDSAHSYLHLTKTFSSNIKLQLSYDNVHFQREYKDENGIYLGNGGVVQNYNVGFDDNLIAATLEKKFIYEKHMLLLGSFVKKENFSEDGEFIEPISNYYYKSSYSNTQYFYSLYGEYSYDYDPNTRFIASVKEDYIKYRKYIPSTQEFTAKLGLIKHIGRLQIKAFLTKTYAPLAYYQLYTPDNVPFYSNKELKNMHINIGSLVFLYKKQYDLFKFVVAKNQVEDAIYFDPVYAKGYVNSSKVMDYNYFEFSYQHNFDLKNKIVTTFYYGDKKTTSYESPKFTALVQLFSHYDKYDFYSEVLYNSAYSYANIDCDPSYDVTSSLKYHYSKDLSLGIRGENIFGTGYKQVYDGYDSAISVTDRKVWFNMEYLF